MSATDTQTATDSSQTLITFPVRKSVRLNKNLEQSFIDLKLQSPALSNTPYSSARRSTRPKNDEDDLKSASIPPAHHYTCTPSTPGSISLKFSLKTGISAYASQSDTKRNETRVPAKTNVIQIEDSPITVKTRRSSVRNSPMQPSLLRTGISSIIATSSRTRSLKSESVIKSSEKLFESCASPCKRSSSSLTSKFVSNDALPNTIAPSQDSSSDESQIDETDRCNQTSLTAALESESFVSTKSSVVPAKVVSHESESPSKLLLSTPVRKSRRVLKKVDSVQSTPVKESINQVQVSGRVRAVIEEDSGLSRSPTTPGRSTRATRTQTPVKTVSLDVQKTKATTTPRRRKADSDTVSSSRSTLSSVKKNSPTSKRKGQTTPDDDELNENGHVSPSKISRYFARTDSQWKLNLFQKYKQALATGNADKLVFREAETQKVEQFLRTHLQQQRSSSLYISGNIFLCFQILFQRIN